MKKSILLAVSACALTSCLASCGGGVRSVFSLTTKDPVVSLSEAKYGVQIKFADGYKFLTNPAYDSFKFTTDQGDKMTFTMHGYSAADPSSYYWTATTSTPGTYKITLEIDGVKNEKDLVLTVKDGQYPDTSFALPQNIHISYKDDENSPRELYKIGDAYVSCRSENFPEMYIPDAKGNVHYGHHHIEGDVYEWEKRDGVKTTLDNMLNKYKIFEKGEYLSKSEGTVTLSGQTYNTVKYDYGYDVSYDCIRTAALAIVWKYSSDTIHDFEVTAIDTTITAFPDSFNLPK